MLHKDQTSQLSEAPQFVQNKETPQKATWGLLRHECRCIIHLWLMFDFKSVTIMVPSFMRRTCTFLDGLLVFLGVTAAILNGKYSRLRNNHSITCFEYKANAFVQGL